MRSAAGMEMFGKRGRDGAVAPAPVPDEALVEALLGASRVLVTVAVDALAQVSEDVTLAQHRALVALAEHGTRRLGDLADDLEVSPSTATRMCDRLVRKGLLDRTRDADDRREVKLSLTGAGARLVADVVAERRRRVAELLGGVPATSRPALVEGLDAFARAAGEEQLGWGTGWNDLGGVASGTRRTSRSAHHGRNGHQPPVDADAAHTDAAPIDALAPPSSETGGAAGNAPPAPYAGLAG